MGVAQVQSGDRALQRGARAETAESVGTGGEEEKAMEQDLEQEVRRCFYAELTIWI